MKINSTLIAATWIFTFTLAYCAQADDGPKKRDFTFAYSFTINDVSKGDEIRLWMPMPKSNRAQKSEIITAKLPGTGQQTREPKYGNEMLYRSLTATSNESISASVTYRVQRYEINAIENGGKAPELRDDLQRLFLSANSKVPVTGIPLKWERSKSELETARNIYERVDQHVRYDKSNPGYGSGDTLWVCDSRFGNCTDFHSLFISMARASNIPTRFEIGFPLPADKTTGTIGGYHCWASWYSSDYEWVPVDISEADKHPELKEYYFGNLTADRIHFTTGRDIDLEPKQSAPALNYFVYPHVEVNGKAAPKEQLDLHFAFKDMTTHEQN